MRDAYTFAVPLAPKGKGRPRATSIGGHARVYTPKKTRTWERDFAIVAGQHRPKGIILGPISVGIVAVFPRPKYMARVSKTTGHLLGGHSPDRCAHTSKPDGDNVAKAVLDALKDWWKDDAQVCDLHVSKRVAALGEAPCVEVVIQPMEAA